MGIEPYLLAARNNSRTSTKRLSRFLIPSKLLLAFSLSAFSSNNEQGTRVIWWFHGLNSSSYPHTRPCGMSFSWDVPFIVPSTGRQSLNALPTALIVKGYAGELFGNFGSKAFAFQWISCRNVCISVQISSILCGYSSGVRALPYWQIQSK
jgi:hypothetical protein